MKRRNRTSKGKTGRWRTKGKGKVWLVGAGPGHPDLLTLRAYALMRKADVIVYDHLGGSRVLRGARTGAEKISVGKRCGFHSKPQVEINRLIVRKALEGKNVVRLKGGDPFLFGRGGEELEALAKYGIEFEVVPGVTSALAAPAHFGIPVTHRDHASTVTVVTGHEAEGRDGVDWELLAKLKGTLVILMGVTTLEKNVGRLLGFGRSPETPVAIIESGTMKESRLTVGNLGNIVPLSKRRKVKAPAVIVIGDVVRLHELSRRKGR